MDSEVAVKIMDSEHFSAKVTCFSKVGAFKVIEDKLNKAQMEMFRRSCFGKLLNMKDLKFAG